MTELKIIYNSTKECFVKHNQSDTTIITQTPKEFGGLGNEFSSTDLLVAALGTCLATSISAILKRNSVALKDIELVVKKELSIKPKAIKGIHVYIQINTLIESSLVQKLERAIKSCLVFKALLIRPKIYIKTKTKSFEI
ncbi:OsmC family protein [Tamlana sp. 2201CG12-4]|uniref:OsmC family protein n=1 Tax=Tamlana sp. 2201CG12-4 TaxID=3112582 RepID=UPI002DB805B0|nr:OsmC family protein [Tamlana sp. 2201CG12-4]MEC3908732.1 OsmC family protein [Tamlana sp. 2201CG12-4]